jgi:hypothetical protein
LLVRVVAGEVAGEIGGLIHVDPQSIDVDPSLWVKKECELVVPVCRDVLGEPVGESSYTRPDDALPDGAVLTEEENVILDSTVESWVVIVGGRWVNCGDFTSVLALHGAIPIIVHVCHTQFAL